MAYTGKIKTQKEAALYVRKEPRTIRRWEEDGHLVKGEDGYYAPEQLDKCLRIYSRRETKKVIDAIAQVGKIQDKVEQLQLNFITGVESVTSEIGNLKVELEQIQEQVNEVLIQKCLKSL